MLCIVTLYVLRRSFVVRRKYYKRTEGNADGGDDIAGGR